MSRLDDMLKARKEAARAADAAFVAKVNARALALFKEKDEAAHNRLVDMAVKAIKADEVKAVEEARAKRAARKAKPDAKATPSETPASPVQSTSPVSVPSSNGGTPGWNHQ